MNHKFRCFTVLFLIVLAIPIYAQDDNATYRVFELLDVTLKGNEVLYAKQNPIGEILYELAVTGRKGVKINAYTDTTFTTTYTDEELKIYTYRYDTIEYSPYPDDPDYFVDTVVREDFDPMGIYEFVIMEDSFALVEDYQVYKSYSLVGIAPIIYDLVQNERVNFRPMFWLKYDEIKPYLAKEIFMSYENRDGRLKYDYYFDQRMFKAVPVPGTIRLK